MASLPYLPVEVLLIVEFYAKVKMGRSCIAPSLQLSWVNQHLRAVFMPRFWSFLSIRDSQHLVRLASLIRASPPDTYRRLVRFVGLSSAGGSGRVEMRLYDDGPPPEANDELDPDDVPYIAIRGVSENCGPHEGETWPTPIDLTFNDPKRYFKLAAKKRDVTDADETDESGSSVASEAEEEAINCKLCHPAMHEIFRHRVKPADYWLPGASHSIGPLVSERRTWGRYRGPDNIECDGVYSIDSVDKFLTAISFVVDHLDFEAFDWRAAFPIPNLLCEKLLQHPTCRRLGFNSGNRMCGGDCFRPLRSLDALLLLAPKLTVIAERCGTYMGAEAIELQRGANDGEIYLPLSDYPEDNSMRGFMDFLLAAKNLKHLSSECKGVFFTPCLLGVYAKLHSLRWDRTTWKPEYFIALSKLRSSLWKLSQAIGRPDHLLEAADVQLLADPAGEHADMARELAPLADWLEQEELADLTAQGWNEQEERGPNESPIFYPPYSVAGETKSPAATVGSAYEHPMVTFRP